MIRIGKVQCIDKLDKQVEILRDFFGNILLVKIDAQIGKTVGEIAHEKRDERKYVLIFIIIKNKRGLGI